MVEDLKGASWTAEGLSPLHPYSLLLSFSRHFLRWTGFSSPKSGIGIEQEQELEEDENCVEDSVSVELNQDVEVHSRAFNLASVGPIRKRPKGGIGQHN